MVKEVESNGRQLFQCEACGFYYETHELVQKCEDFCETHHQCSLEITKNAVSM